MLDFKVKENSVIDLTLIPCPLIIVEVLLGERLEEGIVVANNNTAKDSAKNTKGKGCGKTC